MSEAQREGVPREPQSRPLARGRARREARIATSRELAAAAVANLGIDPQRSILLALQAVRTTQRDGMVLPEVVESLHRAVVADREILTLRDPSTANVGRTARTGASWRAGPPP